MGEKIIVTIESLFDRIFQRKNIEKFRFTINTFSIIGLVVHLILIYISRSYDFVLLDQLNKNYLSALFTPFSFILFYEVFLLIVSIPRSTSISIALQYEIVSLIFFRNVFKDIANIDVGKISFSDSVIQQVMTDMLGGLLMVFLVSIFYVLIKKSRLQTHEEPVGPELKNFLQRKKGISLLLALLLVTLACINLFNWMLQVYNHASLNSHPPIDVGTIFYVDFFNVMIFTDIFILLISMFHQTSYRFVVRNIGFIISTILIRFSLTASSPEDVMIAVFGILFGVLVMLINLFQLNFLEK